MPQCPNNKKFEWIEGNPKPKEKYIQPDLMLEREDGNYDICDLKTVIASKKRITKGQHCRRRFIDYVEEAYVSYGVYDVVAKINASAMEDLKRTATQKIRTIKNVRSTLTLLLVEKNL